jgi:hypothetical protein
MNTSLRAVFAAVVAVATSAPAVAMTEEWPTVVVTGHREQTQIDVSLSSTDVVRVVGESTTPRDTTGADAATAEERKRKCVDGCNLQLSLQQDLCVLSAARLQAKLSVYPYAGAAGLAAVGTWAFKNPSGGLVAGVVGYTYVSQSTANLVAQHLATCNALAAGKRSRCITDICHA